MIIQFLKRKKIVISILILFLIWLSSGEKPTETKNRPIKEKISLSGWYFFGFRNLFTTEKTIERFNRNGNIIEQIFFYNGDSCRERIVYLYTPFDSLEKTIWFTGNPLTPHKFENILYDSLKRPLQNNEYEVRYRGGKIDTFLNEIKTHFYDINNKNYKTVINQFEENYLPPDYVKPYRKSSGGEIKTVKFDDNGRVISDTLRTIFDKDFGGKDEFEITNYIYDKKGFLKAKFSKDSLYLQRNIDGKVIKEYEKNGNFTRQEKENTYDKFGNLTETWLNIDEGLNYRYIYDKNNRVIKEYRPGSFLLAFFPVIIYKFTYY